MTNIPFMPNQQIANGIAVYVPVAAKKSAAYSVFVLLCTAYKMTKPVKPMKDPSNVNRNLWRRRSETADTVIPKTNAQA